MGYELWEKSLRELVRDVPWPVANLANASAFIFETVERLNWAGFYLVRQKESGETLLVLGPFQGRPACIEIPWGRGVCGTAAAQDRPLKVDDVHEFPGHIACDAASASEVVIPLHGKDGEVIGVLDLDSPEKARFTDEDLDGLIRFARIIEESL